MLYARYSEIFVSNCCMRPEGCSWWDTIGIPAPSKRGLKRQGYGCSRYIMEKAHTSIHRARLIFSEQGKLVTFRTSQQPRLLGLHGPTWTAPTFWYATEKTPSRSSLHIWHTWHRNQNHLLHMPYRRQKLSGFPKQANKTVHIGWPHLRELYRSWTTFSSLKPSA